MFEFSLENGKKQLVTGIKCLIIAIIVLLVWGIVIGICAGAGASAEGGNTAAATAALIFSIILITTAGIFGLLSAIKIIFGAVVYHAERTASKTVTQLNKEFEQLQAKDDVYEPWLRMKTTKNHIKMLNHLMILIN